jgi:hypothetical protein
MGTMKGQSATEQFITYGWAVMILLIISGVLFYFGVFRLTNISPERCVFQSGFFCKSSRLFVGTDGNTSLNINVMNKLSKKVQVTGILCSNEPTNPSTGYPDRGIRSVDFTIPAESSQPFVLTCYDRSGNYKSKSGDPYEGIVYVRYRELDGGFGSLTVNHVKVANIGGKVS